MSEPDLKKELQAQAVEPLLPAEKKLIAISFGLGVVLLIALGLISRMG